MAHIREGVTIPKSLKDVCILDILDGTTQERPLTQEEIRQRLADRYCIEVDRKTLHRRLELLMSSVEGLRCTEGAREGTDGVKTDFWIERAPLFDDSELRALVYLAIFSRHIPSSVKRSMVERLEHLSGGGLHREMRSYLVQSDRGAKDYSELFLNIDLLSEAIAAKKKVSFNYSSYGADKKLRIDERVITASPLGIGASDGDFYLLATTNAIQDDNPDRMLAHFQDVVDAMEAHEVHIDTYRLDRMKSVEILDEEREGLDDPDTLRIPGADGRCDRLDALEHLRENPDLMLGHSVYAELVLTEDPRCTVSDVVDHFGRDGVNVVRETTAERGAPCTYRITLRTNVEGLRRFAQLNAGSVEVIKPEALREKLHATFAAAASRME
ncbi:helix-turn-helix transcriptional regulator [Parafannyhessea umbonata]|uniref:helix-turn-helix transcriptional regulator n=1 Tax=Parafannyhessea umbonata TaxID=604330 RepID=UPI003F9B25AF